MRRFARQTEEQGAHPNLMPLLDVVFIMLIFFIVTATFINEVGIDIAQPDDDEEPEVIDPEKEIIAVRIDERDRYTVARRIVDRRNVRANIERLHAENPEAPVVIQPHPQSSTDALIHAMDSAREVGIYDISFAGYN